jgi:hypothetical protein
MKGGTGVIDFRYWFDNIVAAANLIASDDALRRAWAQGDKTITSAYDPDELLEQLLGDLHLREHVQMFEDGLRQMGAYEIVAAFNAAAVDVEGMIRREPGFEDPERLLTSPVWAELRTAAKRVIQSPAERNSGAGTLGGKKGGKRGEKGDRRN